MSTIAVVIPTYRARRSILDVIAQVGPEVSRIYVVDDCCPERTGDLVESDCADDRVSVIRHAQNQGVGGATLTGYAAAAADGAAVIVKIDSDGQMDPALIPFFVRPILEGQADYVKGNRFFNAASLSSMPRIRLLGNAGLSLMTKFSTGYWNIFDPSNGYTALHARLVPLLPRDKIAKRFFFETDMLFYLGLLRAVVIDVPIVAYYGDEESNLKIKSVLFSFFGAHFVRFGRRVLLNYVLRDFSFASLCLMAGLPLLLFGIIFGGAHWVGSLAGAGPTPVGTVMLASLSILLGIQLILFFFSADIATTPRQPLHVLLNQRTVRPLQQFGGRGLPERAEPLPSEEPGAGR